MQECKLIPVPKSYNRKGGSLTVAPHIFTEVSEWQSHVQAFCYCMQKIYGITFTEAPGAVHIVYDAGIEPAAYVIDVDTQITILASDDQGCVHGLASVVQLFSKQLEIEKVRIEDKPDKDYRGLMLDLARHWHPFRLLPRYIDLCFLFKIKYLHLHFMDDEGYTLPSKIYPKLPTPGKSYTFEEIAELRRYAESRGVVLIPEIEMPGHAQSLIEAYPEEFANHFDKEAFKGTDNDLQIAFDRNSVVCAGNEKVFNNLTKLIDEVIDLFPESPYIHLGADEVQTNAWKECTVCREYMTQHHIKDEHELYAHFLAKVTDYVLSKGKRPIVWEGFVKEHAHLISKQVIVQGFECYYHNPDELLEEGFEVINCAWKPLYIVPTRYHAYHGMLYSIKEILSWNVYEWLHFSRFSAATLNPIRVTPSDQMLGAQLCSWDGTYESEMSEIVERLTAFSERTWTVKRYCTEQQFCKKLDKLIWKAYELVAETQ